VRDDDDAGAVRVWPSRNGGVSLGFEGLAESMGFGCNSSTKNAHSRHQDKPGLAWVPTPPRSPSNMGVHTGPQ
jgi:hypothetical protein